MNLFGEGEGGRGGRAQKQRATAGIQEPQGGLCKGKWHTLDFAERARSKDTVGQGKNCAEIFLLCYDQDWLISRERKWCIVLTPF